MWKCFATLKQLPADLCEWWFKTDWEYDETSEPKPTNLIPPLASLLGAWIATTVAFGAAIWGTASSPLDTALKSADQIQQDKHLLWIKIVAYVLVSALIAGAILGISRMLASPKQPDQNKKSRTDRATDRFSRYSFAGVVLLTIAAFFAAKDRVFPGQEQQPKDRAAPYRFRFDGKDGIEVIDSLIFDEGAKEVPLIATLNPKISKFWQIVHVDAYAGGKDSIKKPENAMKKRPGLEEVQHNSKRVLLYDVAPNTTYTLVFFLHPIGDQTGITDPQETMRFLNEYANGFTVVRLTPTLNP